MALVMSYKVTDEQRAHFHDKGYVHLPGVLSAAEVSRLSDVYDAFVRGDIAVPGKDLNDMAGDYGREVKDFSIFNVLLPRKYHPPLQGNVLEQRAAEIAHQLYGDELLLDFDQLICKMKRKEDAVFAWHQDQQYWPETNDTRTATVWLAIDDSTVENGCMRFVPGSHKEAKLRPHRALYGDRGKSHALGTDLAPDDAPVLVPIRSGDVTVHSERILHGSGGNSTDSLRRAYVLAFRRPETIRIERELGFTHSHNDAKDVLDKVGVDD